ncbi:MAG: class I tRNA ligase family protein [Patescibacteria group bacterium]
MKYKHKEVESKWQKHWSEQKVDQTDKNAHSNEKFFMLDMLPYPSGDGLHMGHTESYTASDIVYRYQRMQGYSVLHNQAFDSFGLPAENYAIKTGIHPSQTVRTAGENFIKQMKSLGFGYDYGDIFYTSDPAYYKWTQWLFARFFENDLVYKDTQTVNWCPSCHTTLANEQVEQGECERCKSEVVQKEIPGWYLRITDFADDLIHTDDSKIDWPTHTKKNQNEWIGKSEGAKITFKVQGTDYQIEVFTTRPDTLFGATYMVLAPEHLLLGSLAPKLGNLEEIKEYQYNTSKKSNLQRLENKEKTGIKLEGVSAINPASGEEIPIFIADYVLAGYGTGAIMAVPAHDDRDFEFAQKYNLPIRSVVAPQKITHAGAMIELVDKPGVFLFQKRSTDAKTNPGKIAVFGGTREEGESVQDTIIRELKEELELDVNSQNIRDTYTYKGAEAEHYVCMNFISGVNTSRLVLHEGEKILEMTISEALNQNNIADSLRIFLENYKNKKAIYCDKGILFNSKEFDGQSSEEAGEAITKKVGGEMTATYRLKDWSISRQRYWGAPIPIVYDPDGRAHLVPDEHLPWTLPTDVNFVPRGTAPLAESKELHERTEKLFGEGWTPETDTMDTFVCSSWYYLRYADPQNDTEWCSKENCKYWQPVDLYIGGAEHTYMHLLYARFWVKAMKSIGLLDFDEPFLKLRHQGYVLDKQGKKMSKSKGNVVNPDEMVRRFGADATRMYMMFAGPLEDEIMWNENGVVGMYRFLEKVWRQQDKIAKSTPESLTKILHKTIKKVGDDIQELQFNTAISALMICVNAIDKADKIDKDSYIKFIKLLSVFAPHISQEIISIITGEDKYISDYSWPEYDEAMLADRVVELAIQINGKTRGTISIAPDSSEEDVINASQEVDVIKRWIDKGVITRVIYVPGKICNLIVE